MRLQQLEETTLGLLIVGLHEGEAPTGKFGLLFWPPSKCQDALAGNYLEIPLLAVAAHIATINAHSERAVWSREFGPVSLAPFDEAMLFFAQFLLQSLGHVQDVTANGEGIQRIIHGQHVFHQL